MASPVPMIPIARPVALLLLAASLFAAPAASAQGVVIERAPENPPQDAAALRAENQRLARELDSTRHAVERLTADLADARLRNEATYDEGQRALVTLRAENERLADELEVKRLAVERLTAHLDATQATKLETAATEQQTAAQAAQAELDALRRKLADTEASAASLAEKNRSLDASLAQRASALQTDETELAAARERLAASAAADRSASTRADETAARLAAATAADTQLQSEKSALETQLADARHTEAELRGQLAAPASADDTGAKLADAETNLAESRRTAAELESLRAEKQTLETELAQARETERTLRRQHEAASADTPARIAELEDKLSTVLRSYSLTQAENEKLQARATDAANLSTELQTLRDAKAELEARLAQTPPDLSARVAELEDRLSTTLRSFSLLQAENDRLKTDADHAVTTAHDAAAKNASESAAQLSALFDELRQTKAQVSVLALENAGLKTRAALSGPPPGTTLASPSRPGAQPAAAAPTLPPPAADTASAARTHVVVPGDTLGKISRQYYGTPHRWDEILRANADVVPNANALRVGVTLRIP